ncbi:hypothetical protein FS837_001991, partial [Tulasnella sp. UAMH 9824]
SKQKAPSSSTITPAKMTKRQRKAAAKAGVAVPPLKPKRVVSLVGKKKKKEGGVGGVESDAAKASSASEGRAEWMVNGTGRMDVRGFKELRI